MSSSTDAAGDDLEYYRAVIGPKNQLRYLKKFCRFDTHGIAAPSWNWGALFFTSMWLIYRRQWFNVLLYAIVPGAIMGGASLLAAMIGASKSVTGLWVTVYGIVQFLLPALYGDAFYYRYCKERIAEVRASGKSREWQLGLLTGKGGTGDALFVVGACWIALVIGILVAIAIPVYHTYQGKAQLSSALNFGRRSTIAVERFYVRNGRMPETLAEAGFREAVPEGVDSLVLEDGVLVVQTHGAPNEIRTLRLSLVQAEDGSPA